MMTAGKPCSAVYASRQLHAGAAESRPGVFVSEALTNVTRHARATSPQVEAQRVRASGAAGFAARSQIVAPSATTAWAARTRSPITARPACGIDCRPSTAHPDGVLPRRRADRADRGPARGSWGRRRDCRGCVMAAAQGGGHLRRMGSVVAALFIGGGVLTQSAAAIQHLDTNPHATRRISSGWLSSPTTVT